MSYFLEFALDLKTVVNVQVFCSKCYNFFYRFTVLCLHCIGTGSVGGYEVSIPIFLNDDYTMPYQCLNLTGVLRSPSMTFEPRALIFGVVPLGIATTIKFDVIVQDYPK